MFSFFFTIDSIKNLQARIKFNLDQRFTTEDTEINHTYCRLDSFCVFTFIN